MSTRTRGAAHRVQALPFPASCLRDVDVSIILSSCIFQIEAREVSLSYIERKGKNISLKGKEMNSEINKAD